MPKGAEKLGCSMRAEFSRTYEEFARIYGKSPRTLKRLVADGKAKGDVPPLDQPVEFVAWWERNMKHRVPASILAAAGGDALMEIPQVKAAADEPAPALPAEPPVPGEERGLQATLAALETLEFQLRSTNTDAGKTKNYLDTVNRLAIITGKLREEDEKLGKLIPRDRVETILHEVHGPIERETRLLFRAMCDLLGIPASPDAEQKWNAEIDRLFVRLQENYLKAA